MDDAHFLPDRIGSLVQEIEAVSSVIAELPRQILLTGNDQHKIITAGSCLAAALQRLQQTNYYFVSADAASESIYCTFTDGSGQNSGAYS